MNKVAVIYWSSTGNTEIMAKKIFDGVKEAGNDADIFSCGEFDVSTVKNYDVVVLGCPACGSEELDESEFMPMFETIKEDLKGKKIALFGSYGWGGGEYMNTFKGECENIGLTVIAEPILAENTPDSDAEELCKNFGKTL